MSKRVTQADIARKSRVSLSTVSLVLRDKPGIPLETRQRVFEIARTLGYKPKVRPGGEGQRARSPLRNLGLILKVDHNLLPSANPFYLHVMAGIEEVCRREKINLLYATLPVDDNNVPVEIPRLLTEQHADGLLLVGTFVDSAFGTLFMARNEPVVLVDAYSSGQEYDAVLSDNLGGAREAVHYLITRGHRRIGLIGGHTHAYPSLRERRQAWANVLMAHGLPTTAVADCGLNAEAVADATRRLLEEHPGLTAVFAVNDIVAISAIRAAQALGRRVPEDLSVIAYDDIELAQHISPGLTTMRVDKVAMGRLAVQLIRNRIEFPDSERVVTVVRPRLVERGSVAAPGSG